MTVVAVFGGDNDGAGLRSSSGFVSQGFCVVYPRSRIAAPGDIALLGDVPGAVAVGKGVTGAGFAVERSPAGNVGRGAAGWGGVLPSVENATGSCRTWRRFLVAVRNDDVVSSFETTVGGEVIEGDNAVFVAVILLGDVFNGFALGDDVIESGDGKNEDLVARADLIYIVEIVCPENRVDGDVVILGDFADGVALGNGVDFDATVFFGVLLDNRREVGRGDNGARTPDSGRVLELCFRINRA